MQGYAMLRDLFLYDIASAYPFILTQLPSMRDGIWRAHDDFEFNQLGLANILSMFRVKWKFPVRDKQTGRAIPFYPLPYRTKRKSISFPWEGHAWIMRDELAAAFKWAERFDCVDGIKIEEWN